LRVSGTHLRDNAQLVSGCLLHLYCFRILRVRMCSAIDDAFEVVSTMAKEKAQTLKNEKLDRSVS
jgi:hypothetical protein